MHTTMTRLQVKTRQTEGSTAIRPIHARISDRMALSTQTGLLIIRFSDILYCEAMSNYCKIHLQNQQSHLVSKPLKAVLAVLPAGQFVRTHQTYVVRFDEIRSTGHDVQLSNGQSVPLARSQKHTLLTLLRNRIPVV